MGKKYTIMARINNRIGESRGGLKEAGNMIASQPYNPSKKPSFTDLIVNELNKMLEKKTLSSATHSHSIEIARRMGGILTGIYGRRAHGLRQAIHVVLSQVRKRFP